MFTTIQHVNQEEGFTLLEILGPIALLGVASVMTIPSLTDRPAKSDVAQAAPASLAAEVPADGMQAAAIVGGTTYSGKILTHGTSPAAPTGKTYTMTHAYNAATKTVSYELVLSEALTGEGTIYFGDGKLGHSVGISIRNGIASGTSILSAATGTSVTYDPEVGEFKTTTGIKYIL